MSVWLQMAMDSSGSKMVTKDLAGGQLVAWGGWGWQEGGESC